MTTYFITILLSFWIYSIACFKSSPLCVPLPTSNITSGLFHRFIYVLLYNIFYNLVKILFTPFCLTYFISCSNILLVILYTLLHSLLTWYSHNILIFFHILVTWPYRFLKLSGIPTYGPPSWSMMIGLILPSPIRNQQHPLSIILKEAGSLHTSNYPK